MELFNDENMADKAEKVAMELARVTSSGSANQEAFLDLISESMLPVEQFFANYSCAIMEIETKFKVLNEQFSLKYDGNPIESIKTRIKSFDSIIRKLERRNNPMTLESIEENIYDIAENKKSR